MSTFINEKTQKTLSVSTNENGNQRKNVLMSTNENAISQKTFFVSTKLDKYIYAGSTYQDIADFLYISKNTVKHHITSIYKKLGVASKMDLINTVRMMDKHILKDVKKIE